MLHAESFHIIFSFSKGLVVCWRVLWEGGQDRKWVSRLQWAHSWNPKNPGTNLVMCFVLGEPLILPFKKVLLGIKSLDCQRTLLVILMVSDFLSLLWSPYPWAVSSLLAEIPRGTDLLTCLSSATLHPDSFRMFPFCFSVTYLVDYTRAWLFRTMTHFLGGESFSCLQIRMLFFL